MSLSEQNCKEQHDGIKTCSKSRDEDTGSMVARKRKSISRISVSNYCPLCKEGAPCNYPAIRRLANQGMVLDGCQRELHGWQVGQSAVVVARPALWQGPCCGAHA